MSVYAGIDVHRERSQLAVIDAKGEVVVNRNVPDGVEPILQVTGGLPLGRRHVRGRVRQRAAGGAARGLQLRARTWCTRCGARRSPPRG